MTFPNWGLGILAGGLIALPFLIVMLFQWHRKRPHGQDLEAQLPASSQRRGQYQLPLRHLWKRW